MKTDPASAYHEAGHVVVGTVLGLVVVRADIYSAPGRRGLTQFAEESMLDGWSSDEDVDAWGATNWAGTLAQEHGGFRDDAGVGFGHSDGSDTGPDPQSDLADVSELALRFSGGGQDADRLVQQWRGVAQTTLVERWTAVERVARLLLRDQQADGTTLRAIVNASSPDHAGR